MNSRYAEDHKRAPKPPPKERLSLRVDADHAEFVTKHYHNKSKFYMTAIIKAIEAHPKWKGKS
jgi:hypothetical protein